MNNDLPKSDRCNVNLILNCETLPMYVKKGIDFDAYRSHYEGFQTTPSCIICLKKKKEKW